MWRGRVLDAADQPLAAWSVFGPGSRDPVARTDAAGRFGPVHLYPWADSTRRVDFVAVPDPFSWASPRAEWKGEWTQEVIQLRVRPPASGCVTGRVLDAGGAPLAGAYVRLQSQPYVADRCDGSGRFSLGSPGDDDRVWIVDPAAMHASRSLGLKGRARTEPLNLGDVRLVRGALLSVRVESQVPLARLDPRITLERAGREPYRTSAELEGRLLTFLEPIELGPRNVTVEIPGFEAVRQPIVVTDDPHPAATIALRAKK